MVSDSTEIGTISTEPKIVNEFNVSNTKGTLSMAKTGISPDSATSQWSPSGPTIRSP